MTIKCEVGNPSYASTSGVPQIDSNIYVYLNEIMKPLSNNTFLRNEDIVCRFKVTTSDYTPDDPTTSINGTTLSLVIKDGTTGTPVSLVTKSVAITFNSDAEVRGTAKLAIADLATLPANSTVTLEYRLWATFPGPATQLIEKGNFNSRPALP